MRQHTILVVDDDESIRRLLSRLLEFQGYSPIVAETGKAGIGKAAQEQPEVALIDRELGDMSGVDVLREVRERSPETECILITGSATQESAIQAVNLGAYSYVQKPWDEGQLLITIQRAIEKRDTEQQLRESEKRFRYLFEISPDAIFVEDPTGTVLEVNSEACRLHEMAAEELIGKNIVDLVPEDKRGEVARDFPKLAEGVLAQVEGCSLTSDGRTVPVEVRARPIDHAGKRAVLLQVRDVTERKRAEEALQKAHDELETRVETRTAQLSETNRSLRAEIAQRKRAEEALQKEREYYRSFVESLSDWAWEMDVNGIHTYSNTAVERILGHCVDEVVGHHVSELWCEEERTQERLHSLRKTLDLGKGWRHFEGRFKRNDGATVIMDSSAIPVFDPEGELVGYRGVDHDITARKKAEDKLQSERTSLADLVGEKTAELRIANAALARASRLKDEFLASMSHELRTPLNTILGVSEALQEEVYGALNEKQLKSLHRIEGSGRHLLALINDILDVSKIESGKAELQMGLVSVESICRSALSLIKQGAHKRSLQVFSQIDPGVQTIHADERRVKQVLVNLLSNAVKFTPKGGKIGLDVTGDVNRGAVEFIVWDTGLGISQDNMEQLFKPFVQLDSKLSRDYEGTGLGLALVHRLTALHGGSVRLESEEGSGSRFTVCLPWEPEGDCQEEPRTELVQPGSAGMLTLVSWRGEEASRVATESLERQGYVVDEVGEIDEVLSHADSQAPKAVVIDTDVPKMDVEQAVRRLKAEPNLAGAPVIVLTSLSVSDERERCLAAGADEYLIKPVKPHVLSDSISRLLNR